MKKGLLLGFGITGLLNLIAVWSVGGDPIIEWGFYVAMAVLLVFSCLTRIVIGNANKDSEGVDWESIGGYCIGALAAFVVSLISYWVCG